ncbi:hypothetical protein MTR67_052148 [Solanum verrucosum]|uniref:Hydroxyproline O-arabinosyltransferase-like domain-containing protein n=1 Tax=Solanum verrucosum TaxID=315347 RepID=A0AAF0V4J5_SOLVR|nr:hypothetical protein MTR67_052148 [Solanum verrucosum]
MTPPSTGRGPLSWVDYFGAGSRAVLGSSSSPLNTPTQQHVRPFQQPPMRQPIIGHASTLCADTSKVKGMKKQQPTARASSTSTAWAASTSTARPTSSPVGMSPASSVGRKKTRDVGFDVYTDIQSGRQVVRKTQSVSDSECGVCHSCCPCPCVLAALNFITGQGRTLRTRVIVMKPLVFFFLLSLVFSFVTYNLITMVIRYTFVGFEKSNSKAVGFTQLFLDPIIHMPHNLTKPKPQKLLFHIALTATDTPYSKWQCRIMYYWYLKKKNLPGSEMGKFTRILHSGTPDNLMDEIPTFVVDPLPQGFDMGYIVLNRPWAFVQWLEKATIEEEYILMAEPDHIFLNPLPNLAYGDYPVAFPFFYMKPAEHEEIIRKFFPKENGPVTNVDPIGNSPVIIKKNLLEQVATTWMNISLRMKHDEETDKTFGWVLEMYAYAIASALHGVQHILRKDFMLQGELTYGKIGDWRFNKRSYIKGPPPKNLSLPPPNIPESVGREELEEIESSGVDIWERKLELGLSTGGGDGEGVKGSLEAHSGRREHDPIKDGDR